MDLTVVPSTDISVRGEDAGSDQVSEAIIDVRGLSHSYGNMQAVDDISFHVEKGEIFAFLGPNGAGKSTVINILTTLLRLQAGDVLIAGHDLRHDQDEVRKSIGINIPREERKHRIDELIALVELEERRDARTKELSGGMKRRLEIARGLMTRPKILFLDEPTIGLDPQTRIRMWEYLRSVNNEGTTIFLTTHYMDEADQLSDRISIIDHGRIAVTGTPLELKNRLGEDVMYIESSDDARAEGLLRSIPAVQRIRRKKDGLMFIVSEDGTRLLPLIMDRIRAEGIEIITVNLKKPSMDDVFVHYTGRELRDTGRGH
jgi:ABC-2 type transport system ATP-binding protein